MAVFSSKSNSNYHVRSISLPCRSHPSTLRVEEDLSKFKTLQASTTTPTAETICNGLSSLKELYKCMDDLLNLSLTQQALSHHQHEKWVDELLDGSVRLLDICGSTRDIVPQIKEHVRDLQSALRRRKGDSSMESSITKYNSFRKKMKKDAKRLMEDLKQMDSKIGSSLILDLDHHLSAVIRILREVSAVSISTFHSLLLFLCVPVSKPKSSRWSLVSKLIHKAGVACEYQQDSLNELESLDHAVFTLFRYISSEGEKMQIAQNRLEALEARVEGFENGLECVFRCLVCTRTSLLNIISY